MGPKCSNFKIAILIVLTVGIAHFLLLPFFGFYGDDYAHVTPLIGGDTASLQHRITACLGFPQGRPLHFFLTGVLAFISAHLGGIHAAYVFALMIISTNSFLFYLILKKTSGSGALALVGALAFCLFPPDTTHPYLMHAFGLQTALTFILLAILSYISGKKAPAYILAFASLLNYESYFFLFFAVPLIGPKRKRSLWVELARNAAILALMMAAALALRTLIGESRVMDLHGHGIGIVKRIVAAPVFGPIASLLLFVYQPLTVLFHGSAGMLPIFLVSLGLFLWALLRCAGGCLRLPDGAVSSTALHAEGSFHSFWQSRWRLLLTGGVLLMLSYVSSFTHWPPLAIHGQPTSVHAAGVVGASIIFACVWCAIIDFAGKHRLQTYAVAVLAAYLALTVVFRFSVQEDFKQGWENQRWFWSSVVNACPDLSDGTIVFVDNRDLPETYYIDSHSWADAFILGQIFNFPSGLQQPPRVLPVSFDGVREDIVIGETVPWPVERAKYPEWFFPLDHGNVILLEQAGDTFKRRTEPLEIGGSVLVSKEMEAQAGQQWEKGSLYGTMIGDPAKFSPASSSYALLPVEPDRAARAAFSELSRRVLGRLRPASKEQNP